MNRWQVTIIIDDVNNKHDAKTLAMEVKDSWLPVSHDYQLVTINVGIKGQVDGR